MHVLNFLAWAATTKTYCPSAIAVMKGHLFTVFQMMAKNGEGSVAALASRALSRQAPQKSRRFQTMWDVSILLEHLRVLYGDNSLLEDPQLQLKAMLLTMVFSLSRLDELTRMTWVPEQCNRDVFVISTITKQHHELLMTITLRATACPETCPVRALQELTARRPTPAPVYLFFDYETGGPLTRAKIVDDFLKVMAAAGVPSFYTAYTIKHASVTALSRRGATLEQITAMGRWAPGSRTADTFYNITTLDDEWIGHLLVGHHEVRDVPLPDQALIAEEDPSSTEASDASSTSTPAAESEGERRSSGERRSGAAPPRM
jgi:site-specific recombinase XerD